MAAPKKSSKKTAKKSPTKKAAAKKSTKKAAAKKTTKKGAAKKGAKKTAKKSTTSKAGSREMLISKSKVREALKGKELRTDSNLFEALNEELHDLLDRAARRAQDNKRSTVRPGDL